MEENGGGIVASSSVGSSTNKRKSPRPVVSTELTNENVKMRDAWVGQLRDKRDTSKAIKMVSNVIPGMSHLKRCSGNRLLIGFATPDKPEGSNDRGYPKFDELSRLLTSNGCDMSMFHEEFAIVGVPACAPRTKAQARRAGESWPINFHPDPKLELLLSGCWFDDEKLEVIERCMRACIEAAARRSCGNEDCNGGALAYDPFNDKIMAIAASKTDLHPMWHASMLVVDLVARSGGTTNNGGGAYVLTDSDVEMEKQEMEDNLADCCQTRKRKYSLNRRNKRSIVAYPQDLVDIVRRYDRPSSSIVQNSKFTDSSRNSGYLCTDYWIFLLREPCPMCAMALLHSRVSDIFYGIANESRGVLGSRAVLHATPGLNHRYQVWQGVCEDECRKTFEEITMRCC